VALKEAATPDFRAYAARIVENAQALASHLRDRGFDLVSGGTDNHLLLIDLRSKGVSGYQMAKALDAAGIVCNYNLIPEDPRSARRPSGIRIGTPAVTSRGFGIEEMALLGNWMARVAQVRADEGLELADRKQRYAGVASEVRELCDRFPAPGLTPEA
jgi:glycine hydroxymethyltransferase